MEIGSNVKDFNRNYNMRVERDERDVDIASIFNNSSCLFKILTLKLLADLSE